MPARKKKPAEPTRKQRYEELRDNQGLDENWEERETIDRYALVQISSTTGYAWLTTHETEADALAYAADDGTDSPDDWDPESLTDLDTGAEASLSVERKVTATWAAAVSGNVRC